MPQIPSRANTAAGRKKTELTTKQANEYLTNKRMVDNTVPHFSINHPNGDYGLIPMDDMARVITRLQPFDKKLNGETFNNQGKMDYEYRRTELTDRAKKLGYNESGLPGMTGKPVKNVADRMQKEFTEQAQLNPDYKAFRKDPKAFANRTTFRQNAQIPTLSKQIMAENAKRKK
jgi:hypothetical protein